MLLKKLAWDWPALVALFIFYVSTKCGTTPTEFDTTAKFGTRDNMQGDCTITRRNFESLKENGRKFDTITEEKLVIKDSIKVTWQ